MTKERRLGRGLEALLGKTAAMAVDASPETPSQAAATSQAAPAEGQLRLSVYEIDGNPFQPRRDFDDAEIHALCESIKEHGLLQPILVRQVEGRYQLIAGERRLRAAIKAGWSDVPAIVKQIDDRQSAEVAIVENLQRKDLNALEKAASFHQYLERYRCTQEELAGRLSVDRSTVANLIRLLELPEAVQKALRSGAITPGHARALLPLGEEAEQVAYCQRIQTEGLSVRAVEALVQDAVRALDEEPLSVVSSDGSVAPARKKSPSRSEHVAALEQGLRLALGAKVELKHANSGRGRIVIHYNNPEEFERIQRIICPGQPQSQAG